MLWPMVVDFLPKRNATTVSLVENFWQWWFLLHTFVPNSSVVISSYERIMGLFHGFVISRSQKGSWPGGWRNFRNTTLRLSIGRASSTLMPTPSPGYPVISVEDQVKLQQQLLRQLSHHLHHKHAVPSETPNWQTQNWDPSFEPRKPVDSYLLRTPTQ